VEGAPGGSLVPVGVSTPASDACTPNAANSTCRAPYLQCRTDQQACTCASGVDTCYGFCIPTPCGACNSCLRAVRAFTSKVKDVKDATQVSQAWGAACQDMGRTSTSCEFLTSQILASPEGSLGKRAGVICQLLQDCSAVPSDCLLEASNANTTAATLDLCTVEGTATGTQVPGVQSAAEFKLQAGRCFETKDCERLPGQVCNKQITTDVKTCSAGAEGFMTLGTCVRTPCQSCKVGWSDLVDSVCRSTRSS